MNWLQYNTRGISRTVFLCGKYAIKVPSARSGWVGFLKGLMANMQERRLSLMLRQFPQYCPVRWADPWGFVVIMPRVTILDGDGPAMDGLAYHDFFRDTFEVMGNWIPTENKADSFGHLPDGRLVAVDYGN